MPDTKELQIKCVNCQKWFSVPILFTELAERDLPWLSGKNTVCKHCKRLTGCYEENMRITEKNTNYQGNAPMKLL